MDLKLSESRWLSLMSLLHPWTYFATGHYSISHNTTEVCIIPSGATKLKSREKLSGWSQFGFSWYIINMFIHFSSEEWLVLYFQISENHTILSILMCTDNPSETIHMITLNLYNNLWESGMWIKNSLVHNASLTFW